MRTKAEITVEEAAKIMGVSPQYIRYGLRQNRLPIGSAIQMTNGRWNYHIIPLRFKQFLGLEPIPQCDDKKGDDVNNV